MTYSRLIGILSVGFIVLCLTFSAHALGAEPKPSPPQSPPADKEKKPATIVTAPVYKPRVGLGAPGGRVGGGTRGAAKTAQTFILSVLAPNHTGLTLSEQPVLYWYLTKPISTPMEFTLSDDGVKPLIETTLKPPFQSGVQRIRLSDFGVKLTPGKSYRWFVALVQDPERRSKDILAGGTIERASLSEPEVTRLAKLDRLEAPYAFAEQGLWYDAVEAINVLIETSPKDQGLRAQRAALLRQVGLTEIADYDISLTTGE